MMRTRIMTTANLDIYSQAYAELRATDAGFTVFEHGGRWYEIARNRYRLKRVCGARKKTGERCRSKSLYRGSKCKFHGGLSTGARTPEGKARAIAAMQAGHAKWLSDQYAQARYDCLLTAKKQRKTGQLSARRTPTRNLDRSYRK